MTVIALDVGTSSVRASVCDEAGQVLGGRAHRVGLRPTHTPDGGVEHDPRRLLDAVAACLDAVLIGPRMPDVSAIGIATFWHGLLGFDAAGHALTPIYMWADTRSAPDASLLHEALDARALHARTGCPIHASYWPARLRWLFRERAVQAARVARWGSFGEHLELSFFGEAATSISMASGTGLLDQDGLRWDVEALAASELEPARLFPLCDRRHGRRGLLPEWSRRWPALRGAVWFPAVGDGAASSIGSGCVEPNRLALNVGTSAALRVVTRTTAPAPTGLWRYRLDRQLVVMGGALSEGGNVYEWCRQVLRLPDDVETERALAAAIPDEHGLTVLPFLAGERAPGWRGDRRATISGLGLDTRAVDIARAALEAVALRLALVYGLLRPHVAAEHVIVASGGALGSSRAWAQSIADALGHPIVVAGDHEMTSRGAALLALEALGQLPDLATLPVPAGERLRPDPVHHARLRQALERQRRLDAALG
jgi:gluconokinase